MRLVWYSLWVLAGHRDTGMWRWRRGVMMGIWFVKKRCNMKVAKQMMLAYAYITITSYTIRTSSSSTLSRPADSVPAPIPPPTPASKCPNQKSMLISNSSITLMNFATKASRWKITLVPIRILCSKNALHFTTSAFIASSTRGSSLNVSVLRIVVAGMQCVSRS